MITSFAGVASATVELRGDHERTETEIEIDVGDFDTLFAVTRSSGAFLEARLSGAWACSSETDHVIFSRDAGESLPEIFAIPRVNTPEEVQEWLVMLRKLTSVG